MPDLFDVPPPKHTRDEQVQRGGLAEEMADCYGPAHARRTDPDTSHRAAREVTPHLDTIRAEVERWALGCGPEGFIDEELSAAFEASDSSSYRTRRAELTDAGRIVFSGRKRLNSSMRQCMIWMHASFRGVEPAPERPLSLTERLHRHCNRLDEQAKWCSRQGMIGLAAELEETVACIREALAAGSKREKPDR